MKRRSIFLRGKSSLHARPESITRVFIVGNYFRVGQANAFLAVPQLTLNVTGLADNALVNNPIHLSAKATGINPVWQLQLWVNGGEQWFISGDTLNKSVDLPPGANQRLVIMAVDVKGPSTKVAVTLNVK